MSNLYDPKQSPEAEESQKASMRMKTEELTAEELKHVSGGGIDGLPGESQDDRHRDA
jgi:bacteriocin-like protein